MDVTEVTLANPAKIRGKIEHAGKVMMVDQTELKHLKEAGAIGETIPKPIDTDLIEDRKELVDVIAKKNEVIDALGGELKAMEARAVEAEAQRDALQDRVLELQAQIEAPTEVASDATAEKPATEKQDTQAVKTTSKKTGSGSTKG